MSRVNTLILSESDRTALEKGYKEGPTHAFRVRCHVILLKSEDRESKPVGSIVKMSHVSVNFWVSRYKRKASRD
jgi:hypothetical protein